MTVSSCGYIHLLLNHLVPVEFGVSVVLTLLGIYHTLGTTKVTPIVSTPHLLKSLPTTYTWQQFHLLRNLNQVITSPLGFYFKLHIIH